jgi:hypothetical protein
VIGTIGDFEKVVDGKKIDDVRHITTYHGSNLGHHLKHTKTYWESSKEWPTMFNGPSCSLDFDSCIDFLLEGNPKHFLQIGSLTAILMAGNLAYIKAVNMPDICNIARHIHKLDKGAANALRSLSITKSLALGQTQEEFVDKTIQFIHFLGRY